MQRAQKNVLNSIKEAKILRPFSKISRNANVRPCTVTNVSIEGQELYPVSALHTERIVDIVE